MYPGTCNAKQNIFRRPADLERHYKNVHADEKDRFPCDYEQCTLLRDPFTRKDHYRDHLRDFHKEDFGAAKGEKSARSDREKQKWQKKQKAWLAERKISHKHWRCAKCLVKNNVSQVGWDCASCKVPCEAHRIEARQRLTLAPGESSGSRSETQANASLDQKVDYSNCSTCNGAACIDDGYGTYVSCPVCQPSAAPFAAYDYDAPYNHDQSVPSTSSTAYAAPTTNSVADMFASLVLGGSLK
jgi:hypothetical protein